MPPEYLTAETIAAELGVHIQTVQKHFRDGSLPGRKIGHSWTTTRAALDNWIAGGNQTTTDDAAPAALPPLETK